MKHLKTLLLLISFLITIYSSVVFAQVEVGVDEEGNIRLPNIVIDEKGIRIKSGVPQDSEPTLKKVGNPEKQYISRDLRGTNFSGNDLSNAYFEDTDLRGCDFSGANLKGAIFKTSNIRSASFEDACLVDAQFLGSDLRKSDFTNAILIGTKFSSTDVGDTIATGAVYEGSAVCGDLHSESRADLIGADKIRQVLSRGTGEKIDLTVNFKKKSSGIMSEGHEQISEIAKALKSFELKSAKIRIEGHTDSVGTNIKNLDLSYRRALAVLMLIVKEYDISHERLYIKGYGEDSPVSSSITPKGRDLNRRITLVNLGQ